MPVWSIRILAQLTEWTMKVPLVAKAQAVMLGEGVREPAPFAPEAPDGIRPTQGFSEDLIQDALPEGKFAWSDLRWVREKVA